MLYPPGIIHLKEKDKLLKEMQNAIDQSYRQQQMESERDKSVIFAMNSMADTRIKLDIGGHVYATSVSTLTKDPQSMLTAMISGRHSIKKQEDGSYFFDRDGTHFRYILNFLRDGCGKEVLLPSNSDARTELQREAEYYLLWGLVALLRSTVKPRYNAPRYNADRL